MLLELNIHNFALAEKLRLEVGAGLCVLTGETGAGKSIIVDAMSAALGERTGTEVVRTGTQQAQVEAVFDISGCEPAIYAASQAGFEPEDGILILSREITRGGRSQCRINGRPAATSVVREITGKLIDIHGQHEHQSLLSVATHIDILDAWCGDEVAELTGKSRALYEQFSALENERTRLRSDERERARLLDLYNFQLEELSAANLRPGEDEELAQEKILLANAEKLYGDASEIYNALGADGAAVDGMSGASITAERMARLDPSLEGVVETLNAALYNAQEALSLIRDYRDDIEANPTRLEQIEERLDLIRLLKRKYGDTISDVHNYAQDLASKLDSLANSEERSAELNSQIDDLRSRLASVAAKITAIRSGAAPRFAKTVENELADLAMGKTEI